MAACISVLIALVLSLPAASFAAGDANQASCPQATEESPGFRAFMPDCRAYEMTTPPYKGGQPLSRSQEVKVPMSADGDRLIGIDFAGFAETGNLEQTSDFGAPYELTREPGGWHTEALAPPASMAARMTFNSTSLDLTKGLFGLSEQSGPSQETVRPTGYDFYLREGEGSDVRWNRIGPGQPEPLPGDLHGGLTFDGASDDLGNTLFTPDSGESMHWPGDPTTFAFPSLYQYRGIGNDEPELVGLTTSGRLSGAPLNQGAELEGDCGTILGSSNNGSSFLPSGSAFHAISGSGETIFFTALHDECGLPEPPASEIFARVENNRAGVHTVAISEPSAEDCVACDTSAPAEAVFQGAAEDGSLVYFLSTQALLPGASGTNLYAFDLEGPPGQKLTLIAAEVLGMSRLSEDGGSAYFVSEEALQARPDIGLAPGSEAPVAGAPNLYVFDQSTDSYSFVATLSPGDTALWAREDHRPIEASSNGAFALFLSAAHLTPDDQASVPQLFEYDVAAGSIRRVSIGQAGEFFCPASGTFGRFGCDGNSNAETGPVIYPPDFNVQWQPSAVDSHVQIGPNGTVVFSSPDALTPGAVGDRQFPTSGKLGYVENVYEYREGNVFLISAGDEPEPLQSTDLTRLLGMSQSEEDVVFFTTSRLVPEDSDTQTDWYDARVDGGPLHSGGLFPCVEGTCQSSVGPQAGPPIPSGTELSGGEPPARRRKDRLRVALRQCHKKQGNARKSCEREARRRYGKTSSKRSAKKGAHR